MLADQGRGENGHRRTRMPEDGGGAGEAGACLVGCVWKGDAPLGEGYIA